MSTITPEKKVFEIKKADARIDGNTAYGIAAGIGNLDRADPPDVIFPGFFGDDVLAQFLDVGFNPTDHDWTIGATVAYPTVAKEVGNQLQVESVFHTTPDAQDVKTKCSERLDAGKSVGLSIGYGVDDGYQLFPNGPAMVKFIEAGPWDIKLFDLPGIAACTTKCRALLKCSELYEWSFVTVPANQRAGLGSVKSILSDSGLDDDAIKILLEPHITRILAAKEPKTMPKSKIEKKWFGRWYGTEMIETTGPDATCAALNVIHDDLCDAVCDVIYSSTPVGEMSDLLRAEFEEYTEYSLGVIDALMKLLAPSLTTEKRASIALQVKAALRGRAIENKAFTGSKAFSLSDRETGWDKSEAIKRLRTHYDVDDKPTSEYKRCFMVWDDDATDNLTGGKLPYCDVIDGEVKAVWKAVTAVAGVLNGARGGATISDDERSKSKKLVEKYYAKAAQDYNDDTIDVPWASEKSVAGASFKGYMDSVWYPSGTTTEHAMCMASLAEATKAMCLSIAKSLGDADSFDSMDDCMGEVEGHFDNHKDLGMRAIKAIMAGGSTDDAVKALVALAIDTKYTLGDLDDGLPLSEYSALVVDASKGLTARFSKRAGVRLKEGRKLSQTNREKLQSHYDDLAKCMSTVKDLLDDTAPAKLVDEDAPAASEKTAEPAEIQRANLQAIKHRQFLRELGGIGANQ